MRAHIDILTREFQARVSKNGRYSLRAHAKFLGLHVSALSRVLAGKLELSAESSVMIAQKLKLSGDERRRFVRSVLESRSQKEAAKLGKFLEVPELRPTSKHISEELYSKIATLHALAILQLTFVENFDSRPEWIAQRLGIELSLAETTIELLIASGMLQRDESGRLFSADLHLTAVEDSQTDHVRRSLQKEILLTSMKSLETDAFEHRLHYGMTMAIDPGKLPYARQKFVKFMELLSDELESENRTSAYQLSLSLFPLTRP